MPTKNYIVNYEYTTYLAFLLALRYNGIESYRMPIKSLMSYSKILIDEINKDYKSAEKVNGFNIVISLVDGPNSFQNSIEPHKDIFNIDGEFLVLSDKVSIHDLSSFIEKFDYPFSEYAINVIKGNSEIKNILNLHIIKETIIEHRKLESSIESCYVPIGLDSKLTPEGEKKLQELIMYRNNFYLALLGLSSNTLADFDDEAKCLLSDPYEKFFPIDSENDYDSLFEKEIYTIDELLENPFVIAYFTQVSLSHYRIVADLSNLSLRYLLLPHFSTEEEYRKFISYDIATNALYKQQFISTVRSKTELLFFITLIKNTELVRKEIDDDSIAIALETAEKRLMYMLDDPYFNLCHFDNLDQIFNDITSKYNNNELFQNEDLFEDECFKLINQLGMLAKVFIYDIFEGIYDEELNRKKLAFIKTYYDIAKDKEIISILNQYSDMPDYWRFTRFIKGISLSLELRNNCQTD